MTYDGLSLHFLLMTLFLWPKIPMNPAISEYYHVYFYFQEQGRVLKIDYIKMHFRSV